MNDAKPPSPKAVRALAAAHDAPTLVAAARLRHSRDRARLERAFGEAVDRVERARDGITAGLSAGDREALRALEENPLVRAVTEAGERLRASLRRGQRAGLIDPATADQLVSRCSSRQQLATFGEGDPADAETRSLPVPRPAGLVRASDLRAPLALLEDAARACVRAVVQARLTAGEASAWLCDQERIDDPELRAAVRGIVARSLRLRAEHARVGDIVRGVAETAGVLLSDEGRVIRARVAARHLEGLATAPKVRSHRSGRSPGAGDGT